MKGLLLFIPRLLKLLVRLLRDKRVAGVDKAMLAATIIYVISPLDFIPDIVPFIGQVDDIYLVALAVLRLINRTNAAVVRQHWDGEIDIKELVEVIVDMAVVFLPKKVGDALIRRLDDPAKVTKEQLRLIKKSPQ